MNYENKIILAPMVRVGTLPMRLLALEFGAEIVYTEELIDWKLMNCKRIENLVTKTIDFVDLSDGNIVFKTCAQEKDKVILQIGTADKDRAVRTAKLVENDVSGIDINMGCPKDFSVKGGMGVALAANVEKAKSILKALVESISVPITCKIRICKTAEETIKLVNELASTGIKAIAIHGRTRDERPNDKPHPDIIKIVAASVNIPVICNGGSKEIERYSDIEKYRQQCGASSIMIARAAEWNPSIFRKQGMLPVQDVIKKYLKLSIDLDNPSANTKYCVQNILRELQESEMGKRFLEAQTMEQICDVWQMKEYCKEKQLDFLKQGMLMRRDVVPGGPEMKRQKVSDGNLIIENIAFIRSNYPRDPTLPKSVFHEYCKKNYKAIPTYVTEQHDKLFRSTLTINEKQFSSAFWEKNKKYAEQGASLVALFYYKLVTEKQLNENGSMMLS